MSITLLPKNQLTIFFITIFYLYFYHCKPNNYITTRAHEHHRGENETKIQKDKAFNRL